MRRKSASEIVSSSNADEEIEEKIRAYLAAGAREVWIVSDEHGIAFHRAEGRHAASSFGIRISLPAP